jgi:disulfide bond formation protein DsbB
LLNRHQRLARLLALLIPAALLAGAWGSQLWGGLYPCEMCHWQRWPHYAALVAAVLAFALPRQAKPLVVVAALLIEASGVIGVVHAGVEYHWWPGFTACTSTVSMGTAMSAAERLAAIMHAPMIRCDVAQWTFAGVSLAGLNALASLAGALAILLLLWRKAR